MSLEAVLRLDTVSQDQVWDISYENNALGGSLKIHLSITGTSVKSLHYVYCIVKSKAALIFQCPYEESEATLHSVLSEGAHLYSSRRDIILTLIVSLHEFAGLFSSLFFPSFFFFDSSTLASTRSYKFTSFLYQDSFDLRFLLSSFFNLQNLSPSLPSR